MSHVPGMALRSLSNRTRAMALVLVLLSSLCHRDAMAEERKTENGSGASLFTFEANGSRLVGLLDAPTHRAPQATIIIVHGYGETNVVEQNAYADLRSHFTGIGMNVLVWDKPGRGRSEGEFDINQPVESSADEVVAAVHALRTQGIPGSEKVGLWGISRAGWIAPLAIKAEPSIGFWISVSGVDDKENAPYLIASNLPIEGRSPEETERVMRAWHQSLDAVWGGDSYESYLEAAKVWSQDPFVQFMGWGEPATREAFHEYQRQFNQGEIKVDKETGLTVYVPDFDSILDSLDIPVLALFGSKDTNVDWRKTAALYRETIGSNPDAKLSIRVFDDANHNLKQAKTGGIREMYGQGWNTPYANGYFETMADWLVANGFGSRDD